MAVDIDVAVLCDFAQARNGLLYVIGGGINRVAVEVPTKLELHLALLLSIPSDERSKAHEVRVTVVDAGTADIIGQVNAAFHLEDNPAVEPGEPANIPLAVRFNLELKSHGAFDVRASVDSGVPKILSFRAIPKKD